jgi:cytosine/creatinine deaminase
VTGADARPPTGAARAGSLLLRNATGADGRRLDVRLAGGRIERVAGAGTLPPAEDAVDLDGFLLLPAPAEPHAHYDTALLRERAPNPAGTLQAAVEVWRSVAATADFDDFVTRAEAAARMAATNGATAVRTHVGIYPGHGLTAVEALLEVRERVRPWLDLQVVALTVEYTTPAAEQVRDWLPKAVQLGVDAVGGCPHLDPEPRTCIDAFLALAKESALPVDLHMDEELDPRLDNLPYLAAKVRELGLRGQVTASHCVSLGTQPAEHASEVAEDLAAAGVAVVCNPQTNLYLQAREVETAKPRGLTAVGPLLSAGVVLAGGGDNVQDPFNPMGRADPLETGSLLVTAAHLTSEQAYRAVSEGARAAMGLPPVRLEPGRPAELLALRAESLDQALADPTDRLVIHQGRVVSRTTVTRQGP